jgi:hypothetical protein|tara:strand:- start:1517 stop:1741 length:225 start_codon:yes stop_codon:yes gene_type:complete
MSKITDISIYRAKKHIGHDPDSFRIAAAIMHLEDLNAQFEREYQSNLKAKAAFDSMFDSPLQQLERLGIRNEEI